MFYLKALKELACVRARFRTYKYVFLEIASVFDFLVLLSPVIMRFKLMMQRLWQLQINWDEVLLSEICDNWRQNRKNLELINSFIINRKILGTFLRLVSLN